MPRFHRLNRMLLVAGVLTSPLFFDLECRVEPKEVVGAAAYLKAGLGWMLEPKQGPLLWAAVVIVFLILLRRLRPSVYRPESP